MTRGNNVFTTITPRTIKAPVGGPPVANDIFLHALFVRCTLTNNDVIEFQTVFNQATQTVELIIPNNMSTLLDQITGLQRGPNFKRFIDWLIGSQTLAPATKLDTGFIPSSNIDIWFGASQVMIDDKLMISLPAADMSVIGHNLKTSDTLDDNSTLKVYLIWAFNCGSNTSFTIRTTGRVNQSDGSAVDNVADIDISTFNLISGDIRETLVLDIPGVNADNLINLLSWRNYGGSIDPKTESVSVIGFRLVFE